MIFFYHFAGFFTNQQVLLTRGSVVYAVLQCVAEQEPDLFLQTFQANLLADVLIVVSRVHTGSALAKREAVFHTDGHIGSRLAELFHRADNHILHVLVHLLLGDGVMLCR